MNGINLKKILVLTFFLIQIFFNFKVFLEKKTLELKQSKFLRRKIIPAPLVQKKYYPLHRIKSILDSPDSRGPIVFNLPFEPFKTFSVSERVQVQGEFFLKGNFFFSGSDSTGRRFEESFTGWIEESGLIPTIFPYSGTLKPIADSLPLLSDLLGTNTLLLTPKDPDSLIEGLALGIHEGKKYYYFSNLIGQKGKHSGWIHEKFFQSDP